MKKTNGLDFLAIILLIVGAVNWGLVGFFNFNLVAYLLGDMTIFSRLIYVVVGIASLYLVYYIYRLTKK